jgi:hypothetical protein
MVFFRTKQRKKQNLFYDSMGSQSYSPTRGDKKGENSPPKKLQPVPECDSAEFTQTTIDLNDRTGTTDITEVKNY